MLSCTMLTFKSAGVNKLVDEMGQRVIFAWSLINPQMKFRLIRFQKRRRCTVVTEYIHYIQYYYTECFKKDLINLGMGPIFTVWYTENSQAYISYIMNPEHWIYQYKTELLPIYVKHLERCDQLFYGVTDEQTIKLWSYTITYWAFHLMEIYYSFM